MAKTINSKRLWPILVLMLARSAHSAAGDPPDVTYRTRVNEVRLTFSATDQNNRVVDAIAKDDFAVVDGGMVIRDFRSLTRSNETPLDVVLLVDASESVAPRFEAMTQDVLRLIAEKSMAPADNISVVAFAGLQPAILCSGNCRSLAGQQKLLTVKPSGATPLFDALVFTAGLVSKRHAAGVRSVVILFSDGNDTISMASSRQAQDALIASGTLLYTVNPNPSEISSSFALEPMAEATGGRSFSMREGAVNLLEAILADLHSSYDVTYQLPSRVAGFHSLRILPKHNLNLRFHCRKGYNYEEVQ